MTNSMGFLVLDKGNELALMTGALNYCNYLQSMWPLFDPFETENIFSRDLFGFPVSLL